MNLTPLSHNMPAFAEAHGHDKKVEVVRLEQLYPFPIEALCDVIAGYANLREIVWLQEEPRNTRSDQWAW